MAGSVEEFTKSLGCPAEVARFLNDAGFQKIIEVAMIDEGIAAEMTESAEMRSSLLKASARARPCVNGWARAVSVFGGPGGGGEGRGTVSTERPEEGLASLPPAPVPGTAAKGPGEIRAARSLKAVTRRVIKGNLKTPPPALPCFSRVNKEKQKIDTASRQVHMVLIRWYPSCSRLQALYGSGFGADGRCGTNGPDPERCGTDGPVPERGGTDVRVPDPERLEESSQTDLVCLHGLGYEGSYEESLRAEDDEEKKMEEMKAEYPRLGYRGGVVPEEPAPGGTTRCYNPPVRTASPNLPGDALGVRGGGGVLGKANSEHKASLRRWCPRHSAKRAPFYPALKSSQAKKNFFLEPPNNPNCSTLNPGHGPFIELEPKPAEPYGSAQGSTSGDSIGVVVRSSVAQETQNPGPGGHRGKRPPIF